MSQTWKQSLKTLKNSVPLSQFSVWIQPLKATEVGGKLSLLAPNSSALNYINKNLKNEIKNAVAQHNKKLNIYIGVVGQQLQQTNT